MFQTRSRLYLFSIALLLNWFAVCRIGFGQAVSGDATIQSTSARPIVIKTTSRLAGAIDSIQWQGVEFIDSADHGRQSQSACSYNACGNEPFWAEAFNPTEAGSRRDGDGGTSTSKLLSLQAEGNVLTTRTQMAYWLRPDERSPKAGSDGIPARNRTLLSDTVLEKKVTIGLPDLPQAISYEARFVIGETEGCAEQPFTLAQLEVLTGYMPTQFNEFYTWNPATGKVDPLSQGPGEQALPIIFTNGTKSHAMGVYVPKHPKHLGSGPTYGRWSFAAEHVVKWNCVFRLRSEDRIQPGQYDYRVYLAVGSFDEVKTMMPKIVAFSGRQ